MSRISQAERYLLEQVRAGQAEAWGQLVDRYQGRLLAFAQSKLGQRADAEDIVQEACVGFVKGVDRFRGQASLETYLFTILRRKIIDAFRGRGSDRVCLLQDVRAASEQGNRGSDAFARVAGSEPTASWYARRDEGRELLAERLADALEEVVNAFKRALSFRDLKIVEAMFYCQLGNSEVATLLGVRENMVAVVKHRCIKRVRDRLGDAVEVKDIGDESLESLLTEVWESQRLSCPKRSTVGAYLLETLEADWRDYVGFHLETVGCHFCRANLEDLRRQNTRESAGRFQRRLMESTVGFLRRV